MAHFFICFHFLFHSLVTFTQFYEHTFAHLWVCSMYLSRYAGNIPLLVMVCLLMVCTSVCMYAFHVVDTYACFWYVLLYVCIVRGRYTYAWKYTLGSCIWCDTTHPRTPSLVVISYDASLIWQTLDFSTRDRDRKRPYLILIIKWFHSCRMLTHFQKNSFWRKLPHYSKQL